MSDHLSGPDFLVAEIARYQRERTLTAEFFNLVHSCTTARSLADAAVHFFQRQSQCQAVAVRLRQGSDFPYFQSSGFPEEFLRKENSLCANDCFGESVCDDAGNATLECRCGDIIRGRFDATQPFFTAAGSFWTNRTDDSRLALSKPPGHRGNCSADGYQSIALIPLKAGAERLGLIQLNDKRQGLFTENTILLWEGFANYLAVALARLRAEEALRASEERTRVFFGSISDAININEFTANNSVGRFLEVNDAYCQLLGYSREELLAMSPKDLDDPASGFSAFDAGRQLRENKQAIFDQVLIAKDGRRIPARIHTCLYTLRGVPSVITSVRDMTERKRAEQALRESEQRLMQAVNVAGLGIFELDHSSGMVHCSPAFRTIYGLRAGDISTLEALISQSVAEEREALEAALRRSFDPMGDGLLQREQRIVHPEGVQSLFVRAQTFFEGMGAQRRPVRTVGAIVNITESKHAEIEILASRQKLRTALDAAHLGVWSRDFENNTLTCDELTRSIFCWSPEQTISLETLLASIVPEDRERFLKKREAVIGSQDESDSSIEYRIKLPDGNIRWVSVRRNLVLNSNGSPARLIGVVCDLTRQKQAEEEKQALEQQFRHAQKMEAVGLLAGGIAHDFNNLLMVIRSYAELLEDSLSQTDAMRRNTQAIIKAADRAAGLTSQMLAFSRKQVLSPVALNLNAAVADSAKMLQRLIGEDIDLRVNSVPSIWTIRADPGQLAQVLMNLSVNARDAMPEGGVLTLATRNATVGDRPIYGHPEVPSGDYAILSVTDTGTGIAKEVQERMFEPFFTTKCLGKGTGLGLSTVYGIVKQSGGYLLVDSEPGHGACFSIYLPRVTEAIPAGEAPGREGLKYGTETLLIVEDESALRESIRTFLSGLGYTILTASSGQQALALAAQVAQPIHLMLTDLVMPRMNGRELAQILGGLRPEMKTMYMSGHTDDEIMRRGVQEDGIAFLHKPFSLAKLAHKLRELLD
jgi:PAS domain S-box-containing protein